MYGMSPFPSIQNRLGPVSPASCATAPSGAILPPSEEPLSASQRLQIQLPLPYGRELRDDDRVRRQLAQGWRIAQAQRLSDQEILVTFELPKA